MSERDEYRGDKGNGGSGVTGFRGIWLVGVQKKWLARASTAG